MATSSKGSSKNKGKTKGEQPENFETHLAKVEDSIRKLEMGEIPLEDSIDLYAEAMEHLKACHSVLDRAEKRLEIVRRDAAGGAESVPARIDEQDGVVDGDEA